MEISERNYRQLSRIKDRLSLYEESQISLATLIADIEFLLSACESLDTTLATGIRENWAVLEEFHAAALHRSAGVLDERSQREIGKAVSAIQWLIDEMATESENDGDA